MYEHGGESLFEHQTEHGGTINPWTELREGFRQHGIELEAGSSKCKFDALFELHLNAIEAVRQTETPAYALLLEAPELLPRNASSMLLNAYRKIFSWDQRLAKYETYVPTTIAHSLTPHEADGLHHRPNFCCMIAANKALPYRNSKDLYRERVDIIRWFERNAPDDFCLYGRGWDLPAKWTGPVGKAQHLLAAKFARIKSCSPFPSWKGPIETKDHVLKRTRFTITYENVRDIPGYVTEKIFDAFSAGCVPVYWGAADIETHVPKDCFIDRRAFSSNTDLYGYLKSMSEDAYISHQNAVQTFLTSSQAEVFSVPTFVNTIVGTITSDL